MLSITHAHRAHTRTWLAHYLFFFLLVDKQRNTTTLTYATSTVPYNINNHVMTMLYSTETQTSLSLTHEAQTNLRISRLSMFQLQAKHRATRR